MSYHHHHYHSIIYSSSSSMIIIMIIIINSLISSSSLLIVDNHHNKQQIINDNDNVTKKLFETFESVKRLLLIINNKSSNVKTTISIKERLHLINIVDNVVKLANKILDLNYTSSISDNKQNIDNENEKNFANTLPIDLHNPCQSNDINLINPESSSNDNNNRLNKFHLGFDLLQEMIERSNHLKGIITDMIRKNLIKNCLRIQMPPIFRIPDSPHNNISKSIIVIYQTIANQTAHLYTLWNQQQQQQNKQMNDCLLFRHHIEMIAMIKRKRKQQQSQNNNFNDINQTEMIQLSRKKQTIIVDNFHTVSDNLRTMLCYLNQAIELFDIPVPKKRIIEKILEHRTETMIERQQNRSCSRRFIFECQLMRDSLRLFTDLEQFLRDESHRFLTINNNN